MRCPAAVATKTLVELQRGDDGEEEADQGRTGELDTVLEQMHANALRTRELAERAQAKLDAEKRRRNA